MRQRTFFAASAEKPPERSDMSNGCRPDASARTNALWIVCGQPIRRPEQVEVTVHGEPATRTIQGLASCLHALAGVAVFSGEGELSIE